MARPRCCAARLAATLPLPYARPETISRVFGQSAAAVRKLFLNTQATRPSPASFSRLFMPVKARAVVSVALWIAIVYFFVLVLRQVDWHAVASHRLNVPLALLVLVIGTASRFLLPVVWATVLSSLEGKPMRPRVLLWPYAESWMARYLPGKVAFIGTRVLAANRYGYSMVNAIISGGVEVVMQIVFVTM